MMSQTMPSSYRELFARLKECDDPIERALLARLLDEYNRNHDNDFAEVERFVSEAVAAACPRCGSRQSKNLEICRAHVSRGSTIVGDIDTSMQLAADTLGLKRVMYKSNTYEASENLTPIDGVRDRLKLFVRKHRGFDKHSLQRWCNLFAFTENEKHFDPDIFSVSKRLLIMIIFTDKTRK